MKHRSLFIACLVSACLFASGQNKRSNLIYVDKQGVLRYTKDNTEAAFFGTNYTVPFAYGYRSHKALGVDLEKATDADVYHMARLGLDAFRVHVWDVEISDSLGNLIDNEHLRAFDYLLKKLKERSIKILITPIAFWGNGYPEPDIRTNGFSYVYTKGGSVVKEEAFKAQENYLKQFFNHVNPYTGLTYRDDPDVIAMEINNEPQHSGPKKRVTEYVNRMAAAVRRTGWTKPIFYNISESPTYADAVVKANVDGHSFQWYPTGLVKGHELKGNLLPNVDLYRIPFLDTIPAFKNRARMVYEFDAGDVMQPVMYPAMARSFRTAGFQWATQFAYDPMYTAYANTEYQTHYLNLVYTPAKAISLLIASKAFHRLPRGKSWGAYPADTLFDVFRVSYKEGLSEMNSEEEFYYTGNTSTQPKDVTKLKHIAGVGSSPVVEYGGTGAYFLDKVGDNVWRLEVMPDIVALHDPFAKASPRKPVRIIQSKQNQFRFLLQSMDGEGASFEPVSEGIKGGSRLSGSSVFVKPGIYLIKLANEFLYKPYSTEYRYPMKLITYDSPTIIHKQTSVVSTNTVFDVTAQTGEIDTSFTVSIELRNSLNKWKTVPMQRTTGYNYKAEVPADMITPGVINYRIMVKKTNGEQYTFPGGIKGDSYAWDEYRNESYQTFVAAPDSPLELFNPDTDRTTIIPYNLDWRNNAIEYITAEKPRQLVLKATMNKPSSGQTLGWQYFFGDKIQGRKDELPLFTTLVIRARSATGAKAKVALITAEAEAFSTTIALTTEWKDFSVPLFVLQSDSMLLLPRPYPGFQPLRFKASGTGLFKAKDAEKIEVSFVEAPGSRSASIEVEYIWLAK